MEKESPGRRRILDAKWNDRTTRFECCGDFIEDVARRISRGGENHHNNGGRSNSIYYSIIPGLPVRDITRCYSALNASSSFHPLTYDIGYRFVRMRIAYEYVVGHVAPY